MSVPANAISGGGVDGFDPLLASSQIIRRGNAATTQLKKRRKKRQKWKR